MESGFVKVYENSLSDDLCEKFINFFDSSKTSRYDEEWRRCSALPFPDHNSNELYEDMKNAIKISYNKYRNDITYDGGAGSTYNINLIEKPSIFKYVNNPEKAEQFSCHADCWNTESCTRQISIIIYLSDVEEGGSTYFPFYDIHVKPKKGSLLIFPASFAFSHKGCEVIKGEKYIIVTWLHFTGYTNYLTYNL